MLRYWEWLWWWSNKPNCDDDHDIITRQVMMIITMNIEQAKLMLMMMKKSPNVFCPHPRQRPTCASGTGAFHWWSPRRKTSPGQKTEVSIGEFWRLGGNRGGHVIISILAGCCKPFTCDNAMNGHSFGWANYHLRVFVCEVFYLQVSAEVGVLLVHMLENHLGFITYNL